MATAFLNISIDGAAIPVDFNLLSVGVQHELNKISEAQLLFLADAARDPFAISDSGIFKVGSLVEVRCGYSTAQADLIFSGIVTAQSMDMGRGNGVQFKIICKHKAVLMSLPHKSRVFSDVKDSEIWATLISAAGLEAKVSPSSLLHESLVQHDCSDWDFIVQRAQRLGFDVICEADGGLRITPADLNISERLSLSYGETILDFKAHYDASGQLPGLSVSGWDSSNQEEFSEAAAEPVLSGFAGPNQENLNNIFSENGNAFSAAISEVQDAAQRADSELLRMRLCALRGEVQFYGEASLLPGDLIALRGLGSLYSGKAFVSGVYQEFGGGDWITTARFGLEQAKSAETELQNRLSEATNLQASSVQTLRIAKVLEVSSDPDGAFRIQVQLPGLGLEMLWARVSGFYASRGSGAFFMPEVDDEVLVGFLGEDFASPVVLGSLYSAAHPAPVSQNKHNDIKLISTRSGLALSFNDAQKVISLSTPGGAKVEMNDEKAILKFADQNGNQFILGREGISITSTKGISLSAAQGITAISEQGKISLKALHIENAAQVSFSADSGMETKLSAAAQLSIQGAIVKIN
ncbi:phage baseplate assembly protein V [Pedobacter aquatilis]|uniref:phage baseplate assembly protein V n=1 Tax=Pedobacter aquatilis TaxID=351343 RepID=UPI002930241F|nr:phage baseplate assembly protein V [Pedobacter aquatilis]